MSKVLYLLRHAQSLGRQTQQADYDRSLSRTGMTQSEALGVQLKKNNFFVDRVVSSGSRRARETFTLVNKTLGIAHERISYSEDLYEPAMDYCTETLSNTLPDFTSVLFVGHNPWVSVLASNLMSMPFDLVPCEFIGIQLPIVDWKQLSNQGKLILDIKPKEA